MHDKIHVEWDAEAGVWYIEDSHVPGLVGEAPTLEAMMALLQTRVPEMLAENGGPDAVEDAVLIAAIRQGEHSPLISRDGVFALMPRA